MDRVSSSETRVEFDAQGKPLMVTHQTKAPLTSGLGTVLEIGGKSAAVVGSAGPTETDHQAPKVGQVIVPMPLTCSVESGCEWFEIDGRPAAVPSSRVRVPDALRPIKTHVLETDNDFFFIGGEPTVRGR